MLYFEELFFWSCKGGSMILNGKIAKENAIFKKNCVSQSFYNMIFHGNKGGRKLKSKFSFFWYALMVVLLPYGVLHMAEFEGHMECFIMLWKVFIYEELQSAPQDLSLQPHGVLHVVTILCHMEYSIWSFFDAIRMIWDSPQKSNLIFPTTHPPPTWTSS